MDFETYALGMANNLSLLQFIALSLFGTSMVSIIDDLKQFNRKERFHLLRTISGTGDQSLKLSRKFRNDLSKKINLPVPSSAFAAIDYHLDWISVVIHRARIHDYGFELVNDELMKGNQEDVDLLIGFEDPKRSTHLIHCEAKGVSGWDEEQLTSKISRLRKIFGESGRDIEGVIPRLVLISPSYPKQLNTTDWPTWAKTSCGRPFWLELEIPPHLLRPSRSNKVKGKYKHVKIFQSQ